MTSTIDIDTAAVLAAARRERFDADAAEARLLQHALRWADLHRASDTADQRAATFGDTPVPLGGAGTPQVLQFAVIEFGAALGLSRRSAEHLFAEVLELGYRLPRTWARVTAGTLKSWRARHIANATLALSPEAAAYVDARVAAVADRISARELQRLIDTAIARFMPFHAEEIAEAAEQGQFVEIQADRPSYTGTCRLAGELDLPDALDLERALQAGAEQQKDLGSDLPLGARMAKALGNLARGELVLDYNSGLPDSAKVDGVAPPKAVPRQVNLYLHLSEEAITGTHPGTGLVENRGDQLVTADQVREWCGTAGKVTVRPVLDLNEEITSPGYRPSELLKEQVALRDRWCPFPYCECSARYGDKDHIDPFDPDGPPGQTSSSKLAAPCRTHHRLKTFSDWTYTVVGPGAYLWRSPHGYVFLKDQTGTRDLTPRPVDPPGG